MSEKLRHFPEQDPGPLKPLSAKEKARVDIEAATAAYLAQGKQIEAVGSEANRNPVIILGTVVRPEQ